MRMGELLQSKKEKLTRSTLTPSRCQGKLNSISRLKTLAICERLLSSLEKWSAETFKPLSLGFKRFRV